MGHLLPQVSLLQIRGWVNLNCCSTLCTSCPHSWHLNVPRYSSGRISLVRVTVPARLCELMSRVPKPYHLFLGCWRAARAKIKVPAPEISHSLLLDGAL